MSDCKICGALPVGAIEFERNVQAISSGIDRRAAEIESLRAALVQSEERWVALNSEVESLRMWRDTVLRAAGVDIK